MKYIPMNIDLRSDQMPPQVLFQSALVDHDLAVMQIKRVGETIEDVLLYNFIINGVCVSDRLFTKTSKLVEFLECLCSYSKVAESDTYCPLRLAEFMAYHRHTEQDGQTILRQLNTGTAIQHSFSVTLHPEQLQSDLDYLSINSLSGNYAVALRPIQ